MVSIRTPSTGALVTFAVSVITIGLGVAFAPEIKGMVRKLTGKARRIA